MHGIRTSFAATFAVCAVAIAGSPALAAECKPLAIVDSLPLETLPSGSPATTVKIAGAPEIMLIDTGGAISGVTEKVVNELKLDEKQSFRYGALKGISGGITDRLARLPTLEIGQRLKQEDAQYFVLFGENHSFDGILAGEFLKQYDADFDFAMKRLNLFSPDHCEGKVIYWQPKAIAIIPFTMDAGSHIQIRMELDGKKLDAILDTGASNTVLTITAAQRVFDVHLDPPDVEKIGALQGGYSADVYRRKFKSLALEGMTISTPTITLLPDLMSNPQADRDTGSLTRRVGRLQPMILGMDILQKLHVYVAYKERKLYITEAGTPPPAAQAPANPQ